MCKLTSTVVLLTAFSLSLFSQDTANYKRLYMGNDTHVDLMYNGDEEKWSKLILEMADFYLGLGESTQKEEPRKQSKWNYDCAYWLYVLEKKTPPQYFDRIIAQLKNQQASVPYNFTLPIYGAFTPEMILRSFYYGGYLERKYGIDVDIAVCQENATVPLGLASLWAGSGAKYSWKGVCNCASKTKTVGHRHSDMYWYRGLDSNKILMKWYSSAGWNAELGGYAELLEPTVAVQMMDTLCGSKQYPYRVAAAFGKGWDNMVNYSYDIQWGVNHRTRPGTKLFISNELDFFKDFEQTYGKAIPSQTAAYGNEWDLLPATLMNVTGGIRRAMEKLRAAEALAAIVASDNPNVFDHLKPQKDAFMFALSTISVHGWTTDGPITKKQFTDWARLQQKNVETYVDALHNEASKILGQKIKTEAGKTRFYAFNPLSWVRSDFADFAYNGSENISVKDLTSNKIVSHQFYKKDNQNILRVWVTDMPSMGYKTFEIQQVTNKKYVSRLRFDGKILETPFYKITVTKAGVLTSILDKKTGTEYVKPLDNKYVNDLGSGISDVNSLIKIENEGEISMTLFCETTKPIKHTSRITVYANSPRIDIQNEIKQNFNDPIYASFSINADNAIVHHEEIGAVIKAKYLEEGGHYAKEMSRVDHLSLNHFADVSSSQGRGVTVSVADCLFMKLGNSEEQKLDSKSPQINVLIGGQIDKNYRLGIENQGGDSLFQQNFALLPHAQAYNQTQAMKFSLEHQNPLMASKVTGGNDLPANQYSYLSINDPSVLVWSLKPSETSGTSLRVWNMGDSKIISISFDKNIQKVSETTHVETVVGALSILDKKVNLNVKQQEMKTIKVE